MTNRRETDTTQRKKVLKPSTKVLNTELTVFSNVGVSKAHESIETFKDHTQGAIL